MIKSIKKTIAKLIVKIISHDIDGLQNILIKPFIFGPLDRVSIGKEVYLQNTILNTSSGSTFIDDYSSPT